MRKRKIKELGNILSVPQKIVVIPHKNPDGDALGACLAMHLFLRKKGHETQIISPTNFPKVFSFLPEIKSIFVYENNNETIIRIINDATVHFYLDFNTLSRTGIMETILTTSVAKKVVIDHHTEPDEFDFMYCDENKASTCELVYDFIHELAEKDSINKEISECLYTGILTDTGSFRFPSTTSKTHRIVANLIERGADHSTIYQNIFETSSYDRIRLLGIALKNIVILNEFQTAYSTLSKEEKEACNYQRGDVEGFVNYGLSINGIRFSAIFVEDDEMIRISFRSKGYFAVNEFAKLYFNGGGHVNAAGGRSELSLKEAVEQFKMHLAKANPIIAINKNRKENKKETSCGLN